MKIFGSWQVIQVKTGSVEQVFNRRSAPEFGWVLKDPGAEAAQLPSFGRSATECALLGSFSQKSDETKNGEQESREDWVSGVWRADRPELWIGQEIFATQTRARAE
jgi:hypothetical protein